MKEQKAFIKKMKNKRLFRNIAPQCITIMKKKKITRRYIIK